MFTRVHFHSFFTLFRVKNLTFFSLFSLFRVDNSFFWVAFTLFRVNWHSLVFSLFLHLESRRMWMWRNRFFTCPCHKIYREEAVGLESFNSTLKIMFLWICEIWGNFVKILYFVNNCFIKDWIYTTFCTCMTYIIVIICRTPHFVSTLFIFS